ncbi:hypothetical protein ACFLUT_03835 [Chloroflexota bacterium]
MREAYGIGAFSWQVWHSTKSGKLGDTILPPSFGIASERGSVQFRLSVPPDERVKLAANLAIATTGMCAIVFDSEMEKALGPVQMDRAIKGDSFVAARAIVRHMRNAFAHNPIEPEWQVRNMEHRKKLEVAEVELTLDFNELHGQRFDMVDLNGFGGLARLLNYCMSQTKEMGL